ncbi:MAG: CHAP domain-containing protein [Sphingomonas sp.]|uniref:CHAP domain-containing protein n=1 Tax=Sphingomonas sp. TaxID=28214 RepID=UPI001AFF22F0|nr:CHAP domain-containing protein [Sphingomonas sp.]MBO9624416.1 CHAP domain-containing protein [Sphingomonas sp.]
MNFRGFAARFALTAALCLATAMPAQAKGMFWQCAQFARVTSDVKIRGDAWTWWSQAEGRYERGNAPKEGAIMSFKKTSHNPFGHVAIVSQVVSDREVLLTHANWSRPGGIEHDVRAVDVSPAGDWSEVRVWYAPVGGLGGTTYPVNGFIYADGAPEDEAPQWTAPQIAQAAPATQQPRVIYASMSINPTVFHAN